jgi:CcmD family protein
MRTRHALIVLLVMAALASAVPVGIAAQQPAKPAAQDGFVPLGDLPPQEQLAAAPLVMTAYAVVWIAVFGYLWTIRQRLGRVEHEIAEARRRVDGRQRG